MNKISIWDKIAVISIGGLIMYTFIIGILASHRI